MVVVEMNILYKLDGEIVINHILKLFERRKHFACYSVIIESFDMKLLFV